MTTTKKTRKPTKRTTTRRPKRTTPAPVSTPIEPSPEAQAVIDELTKELRWRSIGKAYLTTIAAGVKNVWRRLAVASFQQAQEYRARPKAPKRELVELIDPSVSPVLTVGVDGVTKTDYQPSTSYWFASVPVPELLKADPLAQCRYRNTPTRDRRLSYLLFNLGAVAVVFAGVAYISGNLISYWIASLLIAVIVGPMFGLPAAWVFNKYQLKTRPLWVFIRVPEETIPANGHGPIVTRWRLVPVVPRPLTADYDEDIERIEMETGQLLWLYEMVNQGVEGYATKNYLRAMGAAVEREDKSWGFSKRPTLRTKSPAERNAPMER